jgi:MFS family permease
MSRPTKLFNRHFVLLWQGQFVSSMGSQAFSIAMMFWIKHATESATLMGLIMMVSQIPAVLLGPLGGSFADRHSRRSIIIWCDLLRGLLVLSLASVMFLDPEATDLILACLFVVAVLGASLGAFFRPAIAAAIPDIVPPERLASANSMNQSSMQASVLAGQSVGGVLFRVLGAPVLFLVDGLTYLFSAVSELFITIPQKLAPPSDESTSAFQRFKSDTVDGLRYVWRNRGLRDLIFAASLLNFFFVPIIVLLPFYVEDTLGATTDWYGFVVAAFGLGALLGYLAAGTLKLSGPRRAALVIASLIGMALTLGGLGLVSTTHAALVLMFVTGLLNGYLNINIATIIQVTTPSEIRGRVFGVMGTVSGGLAPLAMGLAGVVADMLNHNIPVIYVACGLTTALMGVLLSMSRDFRNFLAYEVKEGSP